jgi:ubiquinone/menaquinone biosynthesis C-methylase UbiE
VTRSLACERVRRAYAGIAEVYDQRWNRYLEISIASTLAALSPAPEERILDVGCGTGRLLQEAVGLQPSISACGVDLSAEMIRQAARRIGAARLAIADAAALPFADNSFDAVVSSSSLHHWQDPSRALAECARVVRPGGRLVITDWRRDALTFWPLAAYFERHDPAVHRVYTRAELESALRSAGFGVRGTVTFRAARFWVLMTVVAVAAD